MKVNRWTATYTKHIKQKRKVYQDGILKLSGDKVLLYDDCEKLIDSRFLKKDELVECGGMLVFDSHLVDIGNPEECHMPSADLNGGGEDVESKERAGAYRRKAFHLEIKKSTLQNLPSKNHSNAVHESKKAIENKRNTRQNEAAPEHSNSISSNNRGNQQTKQCGAGVLQSGPDEAQTTLKEWTALYTTQITQKSKRYHDGILQLVSRGSHMNQVILLNEDGSVLSSKYLKSVECVETGQDYEFHNYLVQICEPCALPGDKSHEGFLQQVDGCRNTGKDVLMANQKITRTKSIINANTQYEHAGVACANPDDGRSTNTHVKSIQEWNALYTTQKTQKAKKYHDGILQLVNCSSHMKQAILFKEDRTILGSQYLKSNECVKTGQMREFANYLIEICEQITPVGDDSPRQPLEEVAGLRSTCKDKLINNRNDHDDKSLLKDVQKGNLGEVTHGANSSSGRSTTISYRPICDVSQILSSLKRPVRTPQSSDALLLDADNKGKVLECNARKPKVDDLTGNISIVISDCQQRPVSHEYSNSSNPLSGVARGTSTAKLDTKNDFIKNQCITNTTGDYKVADGNDNSVANNAQRNSSKAVLPSDILSYGPEDSMSMAEIASPSSSPEDHTDANKKTSIADEIMTLQQEWTSLSHRVLTTGDIKNPIRLKRLGAYSLLHDLKLHLYIRPVWPIVVFVGARECGGHVLQCG
ncbi:uncharacterized protein A4U43_C01F5180 [Asparagus officinalis]|uniref:5'-3' DNA helicase ZGRF1-like N-terminal domain-containing protein n=1 Tax=Asparagus officinalis TaxID=4686 RepID=A0A5P1FRH9_ASPOF|nr:uncharacterized protein LOC109830280 [Asparagus officinalis]ONK79321.1 uncharacterized protein A4U43_C01F5180 [Asparagus officinalis]